MFCLNVSTGLPGSMNGARVRRSQIEDVNILVALKVMNGCNVRPLALGDPAYQLRFWLMTTCPTHGAPTPEQKHFNYPWSNGLVKIRLPPL